MDINKDSSVLPTLANLLSNSGIDSMKVTQRVDLLGPSVPSRVTKKETHLSPPCLNIQS